MSSFLPIRPFHRALVPVRAARWLPRVLTGLGAFALAGLSGMTWADSGKAAPAATGRAALSVAVVQPRATVLPVRIGAHGSIAAWQEASVGAEGGPWRLAEVRAQVGDRVRKGQVLASFAPELVRADLALARAGLAEAQAVLAEMTSKANRARELQPTGVLSTEQVQQALTAERTAQARLEAQRATVRLQELRASQIELRAPDDGVVTLRNATVGSVVPPGTELFRMIRQGRLEWRAEVASTELARVRAGQPVKLELPSGGEVTGKVRMVSPTVDLATRNGLVHVDLPESPALRAGMFARGAFDLGEREALTLPQTAVQLREGFAFVFTVDAQSRARQVKVSVGRRSANLVEVLDGLEPSSRVVASGGGFLADGDLVRVVAMPAAPASPSSAPSAGAAAQPATRR
jgi:HlyD family secretion protein